MCVQVHFCISGMANTLQASANCWAQDKQCYISAGPTGSKYCKIWESKCQAISDACHAGNYNGPPNKGANLTPAATNVNLPAPANSSSSETMTVVPLTYPSPTITAGTVSPQQSSTGSIDECGSKNGSAICATGLCCSSHGFCGKSSDYCGAGCQAIFGHCTSATSKIRRSHRDKHVSWSKIYSRVHPSPMHHTAD